MSWSLSVPKTPRHEFAAAVDAASPSPTLPSSDVVQEMDEQVAAAKSAMKAFTAAFRPEAALLGSAYGHANPGHAPRDGWANDTVSVQVTEVNW
jgi:outer membrane protein TolC